MKKRIISLILTLAMLCSITACEGIPLATDHIHSYSFWEDTAEPTADSYGVQTRRCNTCGYTEYASIPMLGGNVTAPTQPTNPTNPTEPTTPTNPTNPTYPTNPGNPGSTDPAPDSSNAISPLEILRNFQQIQSVGGITAFNTYWYSGQNVIRADLSASTALAYSLIIGGTRVLQRGVLLLTREQN